MTAPWKHFVYVQLPAVALTLILVAQAIAMMVSAVPRWFFRADELAMAVSTDPHNYRILLLGDSKTSRATERFVLGDALEIANLSTHMYIGLSGSLFLVQRYLQTHPAPERVVVAVTPQLYEYGNNERLSRYHLWHTFNRPKERSFLTTNHPGMERRDSLPAIFDLQEQVLEPLISLVRLKIAALRKKGPLSIPRGRIIPDSATPVLYSANVDRTSDDRTGSASRHLPLAPVNAAALSELCELSERNGFTIDFVWPPMPDTMDRALGASGALVGLEAEIRSIMYGRCHLGEIVDLNKRRTYHISSFQYDLLHLFGDGWEQRYASDLGEYLGGLLMKKSATR
jgi:hypothetical protein